MGYYDPASLKLLRNTNINIDFNLRSHLKEFGIHKHSVRGNRAGKNKQRQIEVRISKQRLEKCVNQKLPDQNRNHALVTVPVNPQCNNNAKLLTLGSLNVRSARNKALSILGLITERYLDVLAKN